VNGDACDMTPGDLVLTPSWTWHDHNSGADGPMLWFDGLDLPLIAQLDAIFFENYQDELLQPVEGEHNRSLRLYGTPGLLPADASDGERRASPLLIYRRGDTDAALAALLTERGGPMATLNFVDPTTGQPALPTLGCAMHRLVPGERTTALRKTGSSVFVVYQGRGYSVIDGQRFDWGEGDMFVVPSWAALDHEAAELSDLFTINDAPPLKALGLYRELDLGEAQPVRSSFGA
jgi:gentisate 1,2-dioxygenase